MKNIFKIMGVALLASSMILVSCKKDETKPDTDNDTNVVTYKLTLKVNDNAMGTVTANPQKESYKKGDTVVLTATANQGYEFANWSDANEDNPRTIVVNGDATYTAQFVVEVPDHATVTFGELNWTATTIACHQYNGGVFGTYLFQDMQDPTKAHCYLQGGNAVGSYQMTQQNNYLAFYWTNDGDTMTVGTDTDVCVWQPASFSEIITKIDMNAQTFALTAEAEMVNYSEYVIDQQSATWKDLAVDVKGAWQAYKK